MVAWSSVAPVIAVTAAVLFLPGLLLARAARLRGLLLIGSAAPLSVTVIAVSAVIAPMVGVRWNWTVPAVATLVLALALALARRLADAADGGDGGVGLASAVIVSAVIAPEAAGVRLPSPRRGRARAADVDTPGGVARGGVVLPLAGAAGGGALIAAMIHRAIWSPSLIAQAYDIVFHLNGVRYILDTGDASSLHLGRLTSPHTSVPYPAAWHDVVSLVVQLSGSSILVATNVTAVLVCALVWPVSAVTLVGQLAPRSPWVGAAAGVLCGAFPAFPTLLLIWGVLYPTLLGYAMIPAALALGLAVLGRGPRGGLGLGAGGVAMGLGVLAVEGVGLSLAHPSVLFALLVLAGPLLAVLGARWAWRTGRGPHPTPAVVAVGALAVAVALAVVALTRSSVVVGMSHYSWPATASLPQALGEAAFGAAPSGGPGEADGAVWASVLALAGIVVALRSRQARWLVAASAGAGVLYVIAEVTSTNVLTGVWYNDAYRLAPLLTLTGVPLAALALQSAARGAARWAGGVDRRLTAPVAALVPLALVVVAVAAPASGRAPAATRLATAYELGSSDVSPLASANELALYRRIPAEVPAGAVIANDPYDGSSLVMGLADRTPLFTHFTGAWTPQQRLIAAHLDQVGTNPAVCAAARAQHVQYLLAEGKRYFDWLPRAAWFDGVRAAPGTPAFTLVDAVGDARLYRLTACAGAAAP